MSLFRCTSTWSVPTSGSGRMRIYQEQRCEERRWHTGWHHATWTYWSPNGPAEYRTIEWSGEPDHPFERETAYPTLREFARLDGQTGTDATREQAETDASPDGPASTPLMKAHLALLRYGRHERSCPWSYPPIGGTICNCGLAEAIRKSCTNIEAEH